MGRSWQANGIQSVPNDLPMSIWHRLYKTAKSDDKLRSGNFDSLVVNNGTWTAVMYRWTRRKANRFTNFLQVNFLQVNESSNTGFSSGCPRWKEFTLSLDSLVLVRWKWDIDFSRFDLLESPKELADKENARTALKTNEFCLSIVDFEA